MKVSLIDYLNKGYYVKYVKLVCPSCGKILLFPLEMLSYCSSIYCFYCNYKLERELILKK
jgi:DNA-directed RNA polymerase subunit RPC12/RpoP